MNDLPMPEIQIRRAVEADQPAITRLVRAANINPMGLDWRRFLVAVHDGQIVGTGQIKVHGDGSRELASIAVSPEFQKQGIARRIIETLLAGEHGTLYLMCESTLEPLYERFGFRRIEPDAMPPYFRRMVRLAGVMTSVSRVLTHEEFRLSIMRRDSPSGG